MTPLFSLAQIAGKDEVYLNGDRIDPKFKGDDSIASIAKVEHEEEDEIAEDGSIIEGTSDETQD